MEKINPQRTIMHLDMDAFYAVVEVLDNATGRLTGTGVSSLTTKNTPVQMVIFDPLKEPDWPWEQVEQVEDAITEKFGKATIRKARLEEIDP